MCAVTNRAKPYQLALIKKSLDDVISTQQSACEATLQYQHKNINLPYLCFISRSYIDKFKGMCILHNA